VKVWAFAEIAKSQSGRIFIDKKEKELKVAYLEWRSEEKNVIWSH
jgi:hypothetical protein